MEGRVGEDGAASDNLDEHAVRVVVAREGCHEAVGATVLFIGTPAAGTFVKRITLFMFRTRSVLDLIPICGVHEL